MGNKQGADQKYPEEELSDACLEKVLDTFKIFDKDGSKNIDKNEAVNHWTNNYGKLSAKEFFNQVDFNGDGEISDEEFVKFWRIVKGAGHTEEEILEELSNIQNGELWAGFDNVNLKHAQGNTSTKD